ncbi:MAG: fibrobacter succinogenes major paralogous domain-containing protein [Bacteroidota bacterium]|nr:fibrobacter succinogenes major paralogous domain-containing protein [Bacteroidota bacterium]
MKNVKRDFCYFLIIIGLVLFTTNCKKDTNDKIDPIITWSNPSDIGFGTLLSDIQLNAIANVPGTFVYSPGFGTKLNIGSNQILKLEFSPLDGSKYNNASKTVIINVTDGGIIFNPNLTYGTMTDQEGNVYKTISIGTQTWMAENLRTKHFRNGDFIQNVTDDATWGKLTTGAYCNYKNTNNADTINRLGRLYNWFAVTDSRNIAPLGWHVPSDSEWTTLINFVGGENQAGGEMKEMGTIHWLSPNTGATNSTGFTAISGGLRFSFFGSFTDIGWWANFWTSTSFDDFHALDRGISNMLEKSTHGIDDKTYGLSVRLIKDK